MLTKNSNLEIDPKDPFKDDGLKRKEQAELLTKLVQSTKQPFVLGVESPFGHGKTTFLKMWKAHLELEGHLCLYFNAWENDFVDDPMIAFIGEMDKDLAVPTTNSQWKIVKKHAGALFRKGLPVMVRAATAGVLNQDDVAALLKSRNLNAGEITKKAGEYAQKMVEDYESSRQTMKGFREALKGFAEKLADKGKNKTPIVFFIDELDRCRPDFAVSLLERIKHLFQVEGFFFVIGMDRNQLSHSVRTLYGQRMDAEGYLRRFVDFSFHLPGPQKHRFGLLLYSRFKLEECFNRPDELINNFIFWSKHFKLSLRTQEQCFTELNLFFRMTQATESHSVRAAVFLICFRAWKPKEYVRLINGGIDYTQMKNLVPLKNTPYDGMPEAVTVLANPRHQYRNVVRDDLLKIQNNRQDSSQSSFAESVSKFMGVLSDSFPDSGMGVIEHLELMSNFRGELLS